MALDLACCSFHGIFLGFANFKYLFKPEREVILCSDMHNLLATFLRGIKCLCVKYLILFSLIYIWDKVFKSGLRKFLKPCLPQNLLSLLLNTLPHLFCQFPCFWTFIIFAKKKNPSVWQAVWQGRKYAPVHSFWLKMKLVDEWYFCSNLNQKLYSANVFVSEFFDQLLVFILWKNWIYKLFLEAEKM